ncbi:MAG: hypothetical protein ACI8RZ_003551 [Myxococcota bacterium]|jgi:hypothetical protein
MATGVLAIPRSQPERNLWRPVTVRVAWELIVSRIKVHPAVLSDAREHVLRCLPDGVGVDEAERLASIYCQDFLKRVRKGQYRRPNIDDDFTLAVPQNWRSRLMDVLDPIADSVFRMHYADGYRMAVVQQHIALDSGTLLAAREGVRAAARVILSGDGMSLASWSDARLDLLISRIANQAAANCPGPVGLLSDTGRAHADHCPRCSRALRLITAGALAPSDLFLPDRAEILPEDRIELLALLLHPDARHHDEDVEEALGPEAINAGADCWLLPGADLTGVGEHLSRLAEQNSPPRHQLRGALLTGPGRWSRGVLLGPLPVYALEAARARPWSEVDGIGELPPPLPPPPRATRWWAAALLSGGLAVLAGTSALSPQAPPPLCPIEAEFERGEDTLTARFDTNDLAIVDVVALSSGPDGDALQLFVRDEGVTKGRFATGEGDYQITLPAYQVAIISSPDGVASLSALMEEVRYEESPLTALAERIRSRDDRADVVVSPLPDSDPIAPIEMLNGLRSSR